MNSLESFRIIGGKVRQTKVNTKANTNKKGKCRRAKTNIYKHRRKQINRSLQRQTQGQIYKQTRIEHTTRAKAKI